jgi:hypothetical protein
MIKNDETIAGFFPATVMPYPDWWRFFGLIRRKWLLRSV